MMADQNLPIKTGKEYWTLMEKTAARVESWPQWKIGERSMRFNEIESAIDCLQAPEGKTEQKAPE